MFCIGITCWDSEDFASKLLSKYGGEQSWCALVSAWWVGFSGIVRGGAAAAAGGGGVRLPMWMTIVLLQSVTRVGEFYEAIASTTPSWCDL